MEERAYRLEAGLLDTLIQSGIPGVYILGIRAGGQFLPIYVGRSDEGLLSRLSTHNHRPNATHVVWRPTRTVKDAYYLECTFYHTYEDEAVLNRIHPASPGGSGLRCPVCSETAKDLQVLGPR